MTEIDTSRGEVENLARYNETREHKRPHTPLMTISEPEPIGVETAAMLRALLARVEQAERQRDAAWNAAIEAAAQWLKDECLGVTAENMTRALKRGSTDD